MHLPELALSTGGFRGFGCQLGVGMRCDNREMPERKPDAMFEMLEHDLDAVIGLRADGALEIAVFDDDYARVRSAEDMVDRAQRHRRDSWRCRIAHEMPFLKRVIECADNVTRSNPRREYFIRLPIKCKRSRSRCD